MFPKTRERKPPTTQLWRYMPLRQVRHRTIYKKALYYYSLIRVLYYTPRSLLSLPRASRYPAHIERTSYLHKENRSSENVRTFLWCRRHYMCIYIYNVLSPSSSHRLPDHHSSAQSYHPFVSPPYTRSPFVRPELKCVSPFVYPELKSVCCLCDIGRRGSRIFCRRGSTTDVYCGRLWRPRRRGV